MKPSDYQDSHFAWEADPNLLVRLAEFAERAGFLIQAKERILKNIPQTITACQEAIHQGRSQASPEYLATLQQAGASLQQLFGEAENFLKTIDAALANPQLLPESQEQLQAKKASILGLHTAISRELSKMRLYKNTPFKNNFRPVVSRDLTSSVQDDPKSPGMSGSDGGYRSFHWQEGVCEAF